MTEILSFPSYLPDKKTLRALLLFYDKVNTIVPRTDQWAVSQREHALDFNADQDGDLVSFISPNFDDLNWYDETVAQKACGLLISEAEASAWYSEVRKEDPQSSDLLEPDDSFYQLLLSKGWKHVALEKFPSKLLKRLNQKSLAFKAVSYQSEINPVLIEPRIAELILGRLARNISERTDISGSAQSHHQLSSFLYDKKPAITQKRAQLVSMTINIDIPQRLERLSHNSFMDVRREYASLRGNLGNLSTSLLQDLDLDRDLNTERFSERLNDYYSDVSNAISLIKADSVDPKYKMVVQLVSSVFDLGVSTASGVITANPAIADGLAKVFKLFDPAEKLSVSNFKSEKYNETEYVKRVGAMRNRIQRAEAYFPY